MFLHFVIGDMCRNISNIKIETMIDQIKIETKQVAHSMEQNTKKIADSVIYYETAEQAFQTIDHSVEQVFSKVQTTSAAIEQMTAISNELTKTMKRLKHLAQQVMQKSKESAVTVEEQLAMNEQISSAAQTLAKLSDQLRATVELFRT